MKLLDHPLKPITRMMHKKAEEVSSAYNLYLQLKAEKDHKNATMMATAPNESIAARKAWVEAQDEHYSFMLDLVRAESVYEKAKLEFKVLECEYYAQLACYKIEHKLIERGQHE